MSSKPLPYANLKEIERRTRKYREDQKRKQVIKEANFEKFVSEMKALFNEMKVFLADDDHLNVHLIVEERDKLWMSSTLKGPVQFRRKVVTLAVENLRTYSGSSNDIQVKRMVRIVKPEHKKTPF